MSNSKEGAFEKQIKHVLQKRCICLVECDIKKYQIAINAILQNISHTKHPCIYVAITKSYQQLVSTRKKKMNMSQVFVIDCISKASGVGSATPNIVYVENPGSLTAISLAINAALNTSNFKILFLDSITSLRMHNNETQIQRFLQYLVTRLKHADTGAILLSLNDENTKKILPVVAQFCDEAMLLK